MTLERTRAYLAFILVGGFALITFVTIILVVLGYMPATDAIEILKAFSSVFSGFVGLVVGYYFGRSAEGSTSSKEKKITSE